MSMQASAPPDPPLADLFTKRGATPITRRRLRNEAAALRHAAHPDVVRLVGLHDLGDHTELHTERIGDRTLLDAAPTEGPAALSLATTMAAAIADLHSIGMVHGRLGPDHVLVRADGRPVLCGFAEAGPGSPLEDVRALGVLFELLATAIPHGRSRRDQRAVAALIAAADHARTTTEPTATELVRLLGTSARRTQRAARTRPGKRTLAIGATVAVVATALLLASRSFGGSSTASVLSVAPTAPTTATPAPPPTTAAPAPPPTTAAATGTRPDDGVVFDAQGSTFSVGTRGDVVVVGDWDCDGALGVALLQTSDGDVFVFDRLATAEEPVAGRFVATISGAIGLDVLDQDNGCSSLTARHPDGTPQIVPVGAR